MRKLFLICPLSITACAVMVPAAKAMKDVPIESGIVVENCAGQMQSALYATIAELNARTMAAIRTLYNGAEWAVTRSHS
ncbi:MAG: hypothetical protein WBE14_11375 [Xanthobacteraceae bacterium]|jgi:hypothetical protein